MRLGNDLRMEGFVYVFRQTDPLLDNRIKVGFSNDPRRRQIELSGSASPYPCEIYHVWAVKDMRAAEYIAHKTLRDHRVVPNREHFHIIPLCDLDSILCEFVDPDIGMYREDVISQCLYSLVELIDDDFEFAGIAAYSADISQLTEYSRQRRLTKENPNNPNRFMPLFWFEDGKYILR